MVYTKISDLSKVKQSEKDIQCICEECGKQFEIANGKTARKKAKKFSKLLCRQCQLRETSLAKYGTVNPGCSAQALAKIRSTNLERYGVESTWKSKSIIAKILDTKKKNGTLAPKHRVHHDDAFKERQSKRAKEVQPWKHITKKSREKMSEASKSYWLSLDQEERELIRSKSRKRYMYEDGQKFDSSWELALWIYAKDNNIPIEREPISIEFDNGHICYPDFRYKDKLIEIKGSQFFDEEGKMICPYNRDLDKHYEMKHQAMVKAGVKFLRKEDLKFAFDYIDNKYSTNFLKLFDTHLKFPYPNEDLSDTSDYGLIRHFHKSIWSASKKGDMSPYSAFMLKQDFRKVALNRLKYVGSCKPLDILHGYSVMNIHSRVSVFKPTIAKNLIDKYLNSCKSIVDPFSGFSGRMLGAFNCGKAYIGKDINEDHVRESNEIIKFKNMRNCSVRVEDLLKKQDIESYDALFTCPPYEGKEHWNDDEVERSCDEWIDLCLKHYACKAYLFVVDSTNKWKDSIAHTIKTHTMYGDREEKVVLITS